MNFVDILISLIPIVPVITKLLAGDSAGKIAEQIVKIAESITGKEGIDAVEGIKESEQHKCDFLCQLSRLDEDSHNVEN